MLTLQNLILPTPLVVIAAAFLFSGNPATPAAAALANIAPAGHLAPLAASSPAATAPARWNVRGEWVSVGRKTLDGVGPADSVRPTGQQVGAALGNGLTFTGSAAVAMKIPGQEAAVGAVALYAAERPGLAFLVAPAHAGPVSVVVPDAPATDWLPLTALCASCVHRPA